MKDPLRSVNAKQQPRTPSGQWASSATPFGSARADLSSDDQSDIDAIGRECLSGRQDSNILDAMEQAGVTVDRDQWEQDEELRQAARSYYAQRYAEAYRS